LANNECIFVKTLRFCYRVYFSSSYQQFHYSVCTDHRRGSVKGKN